GVPHGRQAAEHRRVVPRSVLLRPVDARGVRAAASAAACGPGDPTVRRVVATLVVASLATVGLGACGKKDELRDKVLASLRRTEATSYKFVYVDQRPKTTFPGVPTPPPNVTVQGLVEDDFRFKARAALND